MTGPEAIDVAREAIAVLLKASAPMLAAALVVGLTVALFQALTQVQEMTLVFVPKILSIFMLLILTLPFIGQLLGGLMHSIIDRIIAG